MPVFLGKVGARDGLPKGRCFSSRLMVGLWLHLWRRENFRKIGDRFGGLIWVDAATSRYVFYQWARLLVRS